MIVLIVVDWHFIWQTPASDVVEQAVRNTVKGWVSVILNLLMPGLVKVGYSRRDPELRAKELHHPGSPHPYIVDYEMRGPDLSATTADCCERSPELKDGTLVMPIVQEASESVGRIVYGMIFPGTAVWLLSIIFPSSSGAEVRPGTPLMHSLTLRKRWFAVSMLVIVLAHSFIASIASADPWPEPTDRVAAPSTPPVRRCPPEDENFCALMRPLTPDDSTLRPSFESNRSSLNPTRRTGPGLLLAPEDRSAPPDPDSEPRRP